MRKFLLSAVCLTLTSMLCAGASDPYAALARPPVLVGDIAIDYTLLGGGVWSHLYTIQTFDAATGAFSGFGHYIPDASYTEIITGSVTGNTVSFHVLYTGTNANYTVDAMGTIDPNGQLTGIAISPGQSFTWIGVPAPR